MYITVDLDDTLISTQCDYDDSIKRFSQWIATKSGIDPQQVADRVNQVDQENLDHYGLDAERFPNTFDDVLEEYITDPTQEDYRKARRFGDDAFLSVDKYRERGLRPGAKDLLETLKHGCVEAHLLTAGDAEIQMRKIEALDLEDYFETISIVGLTGKEKVLTDLDATVDGRNVVHVGNSYHSDVKTALDAGVNVVYIPDSEWRTTTVSNGQLEDNSNVFIYESIADFANDLRAIFENPDTHSGPLSKIKNHHNL